MALLRLLVPSHGRAGKTRGGAPGTHLWRLRSGSHGCRVHAELTGNPQGLVHRPARSPGRARMAWLPDNPLPPTHTFTCC